MIFDVFLSLLVQELNGIAPPISSLKWGQETVRLTAPAELVPSIFEKGVPDNLPDLTDFAMPKPPEGYVGAQK